MQRMARRMIPLGRPTRKFEGKVTGAVWYILGIPWTRHTIGWFPEFPY